MRTTRSAEAILDVAKEACRAAGALMRSSRIVPGSVVLTAHDGVSSSQDHDSHTTIVSVISRSYPSDQILSEESSIGLDEIDLSRPLWIVDPVDGSSNLLHGHPHVGVSVAYMEDGNVLAGAVYAPFLDELYSATRRGGAWCGSESIRVDDVTELAYALVGTGIPHDRRALGPVLRRFELLMQRALDLRRAGSPTLDICYVARGRLAAHTETLAPWDIAAANLIAVEAGAVRILRPGGPGALPVDLDGDGYCICAPGIADELRTLLAEVDATTP